MTHRTVPGLHNYPAPPQSGYNSHQGVPLPQTFHTFHLDQQQYPHSQATYQPQLPFQMPTAWPPTTDRHTGPPVNHADDRNAAKHRARSLDPGPRVPPPIRFTNLPPMPPQQQQAPVVATESHHHHHHHRSHHHQPQPPNIQITNPNPPVEPGKDQNVPLVRKELLQSNKFISIFLSERSHSPSSSSSSSSQPRCH